MTLETPKHFHFLCFLFLFQVSFLNKKGGLAGILEFFLLVMSPRNFFFLFVKKFFKASFSISFKQKLGIWDKRFSFNNYHHYDESHFMNSTKRKRDNQLPSNQPLRFLSLDGFMRLYFGRPSIFP